MNGMGRALVPVALLALTAAPAAAQQQEGWTWEGRLAAGQVIEVKGVVGSIRALPASGDRVEVVAEKRSGRGEVQRVALQVVEHEHGVTICAMYPTPAYAPRNECVPLGEGRMGNFGTDVVVDFTVRVPAGVALGARTAVGDVEARELGGDVEASTAAGNISVSTRGAVNARTVGGWIQVSIGAERLLNDVELTTIGGDITLELPAGLDADLHLRAVGEIRADFPVTPQGRPGPGRLRGRIGAGGPQIFASTMGGDIRLRRRP